MTLPRITFAIAIVRPEQDGLPLGWMALAPADDNAAQAQLFEAADTEFAAAGPQQLSGCLLHFGQTGWRLHVRLPASLKPTQRKRRRKKTEEADQSRASQTTQRPHAAPAAAAQISAKGRNTTKSVNTKPSAVASFGPVNT